jgi:hypothetical protein
MNYDGSRSACGNKANPVGRLPHPSTGQQQSDPRRPMMIRYEASIPRAACGLAAIAMTALVFGLAVVLPATIDTSVDDYATAGCTPTPAADAA